MRPLDPGTGCILLAELLGRLPPAGRLERLVILARLQSDDPRFLLRLRALHPERTRRAILPREPRLEDHAVGVQVAVRREKARIFSGCESRPATRSLQPVAIGAAVEP